MKKIIMIIPILLSFCSCSFPSRNFKEDTPIIFTQTETLKYNSESLKNDFIKSEYYDEVKFGNVEKMGVYNYMPLNYSKEYKIDVFEIEQINDSVQFINYVYFLKYEDKIYNLITHTIRSDDTNIINWSFAISDLNKDGYFELTMLLSFDKICFCFDSKNMLLTYEELDDNNYHLLALQGENLVIYSSIDMVLSNDDKYEKTIVKNNKKVKFNKSCYKLSAQNYEAEILFSEYTANFPVIMLPFCKFLSYANIETTLTWTGKEFSYGCPTTTQVGIEFVFYNDETEIIIKIDELTGEATPKRFTISEGDTIKVHYPLFIQMYSLDIGTYNMKAFYSKDEAKEEIIVEDVFTIEYC